MGNGLDYDGLQKQNNCECCSPRTMNMTATAGHKWTEKEIKSEIIYLSKEVIEARWYNRVERIRRLKHWIEKLQRLENYKNEFHPAAT